MIEYYSLSRFNMLMKYWLLFIYVILGIYTLRVFRFEGRGANDIESVGGITVALMPVARPPCVMRHVQRLVLKC